MKTNEEKWIEGLPSKAGNYWFFILHKDKKRYPGTVQQGVCLKLDGKHFSVCNGNGILFVEDFGLDSPNKIWHIPLKTPSPPNYKKE